MTEQILKQSTSEGTHPDSGSREDSLERAKKSQLSEFAQKKSVMEYLHNQGNFGFTNQQRVIQTNSIFDSREVEELDNASLSKQIMLQDSIDLDKSTYVDEHVEQNAKGSYGQGSSITSQRRYSQVQPNIGGQNSNLPDKGPFASKVVKIQKDIQKTPQQINNKVGMINQYNSKSIASEVDEATITLTSTIRRFGNNSQITNKNFQIQQNQPQFQEQKLETTTYINDSEIQVSIDKTKLKNQQKYNETLKNNSIQNNVNASNLIQDVNRQALETERSPLKSFQFQNNISMTGRNDGVRIKNYPNELNCSMTGKNIGFKDEIPLYSVLPQKMTDFPHMTKDQERREKKSIFDKLSQQNTNKLLQSYAQQDLQSQKQQIRKQRDKMQDVIKLMQHKIKNKKKQIEIQKESNLKVAAQIKQQFAMFERLNQLEAISLISRLENNSLDRRRIFDKMSSNSQFGSQINQYEVFNSEDSIYDLPTGKIPKDNFKSNIFENQAEISNLYKYFFENDLNTSMQRTQMQLQNVKGKKDAVLEESEVVQAENQLLRNTIKRYQRMVKQIQINIESGYPVQHTINGEASQSGLESHQLGNRKQSSSVKIAEIDEIMYKHQRTSYNNSPLTGAKNIQKKGSVGGDTPKINLGVGFQSQNRPTTMSFGMAKPPQFIDIRKAEQLNLSMLHISRSHKAIDSVVMILQMVKTVLKASKVCLFIIEPELQERLFSGGQRKHNYKKIQIGTSTVLTVFINIEDIMDPIFRQVDQVSQVINQKHILLPLWDSEGTKIPQQCLQVLYDDKKINARTSKKSKKNMSAKTKSKSQDKGAAKTVRSGSNSASRISLSTQYKFGGVSSMIQGWNQNDFSLTKLMIVFLQLNTDYFDMQVVMAQKKRKVTDVINFAIEMMQVRSYRQLVKGLSTNVQQLLGFSIGKVFFQNSQSKQNILFQFISYLFQIQQTIYSLQQITILDAKKKKKMPIILILHTQKSYTSLMTKL